MSSLDLKSLNFPRFELSSVPGKLFRISQSVNCQNNLEPAGVLTSFDLFDLNTGYRSSLWPSEPEPSSWRVLSAAAGRSGCWGAPGAAPAQASPARGPQPLPVPPPFHLFLVESEVFFFSIRSFL